MYIKEHIGTFKIAAGSSLDKEFKIEKPGLAALEFSAVIKDFTLRINDDDRYVETQYADFDDWNSLRYLSDIEPFIPANLSKTLVLGERVGDIIAGLDKPVKINIKGKATTGTGDIQYDVYALYSEYQSPTVVYKQRITDSGTGGRYRKIIDGFGNMKIIKSSGTAYITVLRNGKIFMEFPQSASAKFILGKNEIYNSKDKTTIILHDTATTDSITIEILRKAKVKEWKIPMMD